MKIRTGFVSNSSSASFVIAKSVLTQHQIDAIKDNGTYAKKQARDNGWREDLAFAWDIVETEHSLRGEVSMANFDIRDLLKDIGVPEEEIQYCAW